MSFGAVRAAWRILASASVLGAFAACSAGDTNRPGGADGGAGGMEPGGNGGGGLPSNGGETSQGGMSTAPDAGAQSGFGGMVSGGGVSNGGVGGVSAGAGGVPAGGAGGTTAMGGMPTDAGFAPDASALGGVGVDAGLDAGATEPVPGVPAPVTFQVGLTVPTASFCGIAFDHVLQRLWVTGCNAAELISYDLNGVEADRIAVPGESANDVDIDFSPPRFTVNDQGLSEATLLFFNGETGPTELYVLDKSNGNQQDVLDVAFGNSHVVGGAAHRRRGTFFLVQDRVAGATLGNVVAEVDPDTGALLNDFSIATSFDVNYGDIEVCQTTGNLLVVSSVENSVAEFTPDGTFRFLHPLPAGVSNLSGIAVDDDTGDVWVGTLTGTVTQLQSGLCPVR